MTRSAHTRPFVMSHECIMLGCPSLDMPHTEAANRKLVVFPPVVSPLTSHHEVVRAEDVEERRHSRGVHDAHDQGPVLGQVRCFEPAFPGTGDRATLRRVLHPRGRHQRETETQERRGERRASRAG